MARIRYLAFLSADPGTLGDFYRHNFGLGEVGGIGAVAFCFHAFAGELSLQGLALFYAGEVGEGHVGALLGIL